MCCSFNGPAYTPYGEYRGIINWGDPQSVSDFDRVLQDFFLSPPLYFTADLLKRLAVEGDNHYDCERFRSVILEDYVHPGRGFECAGGATADNDTNGNGN